ncbi:PEP/pyruvate-binding domain-containing protein [Sphaerisporangium fuscum]|uniref:PEP/pyruvate-binding domain-containing protein n=1 Tax=Sphaerisporangium fuscum TaxID=2835868 RepID=UPI001BDCB622|nr:PEP/pyruvate-binding domain-containing protein [Sphaerisporangium fuscum]
MGSFHDPVRLVWLDAPGASLDIPLGLAAMRMRSVIEEWKGPTGFCAIVPPERIPPAGRLGLLGPIMEGAYEELDPHEPDPAVDLRICVTGADTVPPPLTFRNIRGREAVESGVLELFGWVAKQDAGEGVLLLVQRFVPARVTAVVSAPDPGSVRVTACWGLGEDLLSGGTSADTFVLRRADLALQAVERAVKPWRDIPADVGVTRASTPFHLRNVLCLSSEQVLDLARRGLAVMERMGRAIPVEFALTMLGPRLSGTGGYA